MTLPNIPENLAESSRVMRALEDFIVEAIDEATDILATGDMTTRLALIKTILTSTLKAKEGANSTDAEQILEQARSTLQGLFDA